MPMALAGGLFCFMVPQFLLCQRNLPLPRLLGGSNEIICIICIWYGADSGNSLNDGSDHGASREN